MCTPSAGKSSYPYGRIVCDSLVVESLVDDILVICTGNNPSVRYPSSLRRLRSLDTQSEACKLIVHVKRKRENN